MNEDNGITPKKGQVYREKSTGFLAWILFLKRGTRSTVSFRTKAKPIVTLGITQFWDRYERYEANGLDVVFEFMEDLTSARP